jgi:hypothetical protein
LLVKRFFFLLNAAFAMAILDLISQVHLSSSVIWGKIILNQIAASIFLMSDMRHILNGDLYPYTAKCLHGVHREKLNCARRYFALRSAHEA